jgi:PAS domain S-box-containing protein
MDTRKSKILVVEDEFIVAEDLRALLHRLGYDVTDICATGEAVVEAVLSNAPDLILMDIKLEGPQDGVQTALQLRTMCDIPVIYVTALTDDDTLDRAKITEPFGYIIKPFEEREIHSSIEITLYKHAMDRKLRARDAWYRRALCSLHEGVITSDAAGRVTFLNAQAEELTGWNAEEAVGRSLSDVLTVIDDSTSERVDSLLERVLHDSVILGDANHRMLISRHGRCIPIEESVAPLIDDRGEITGTVLLFRDVEERWGEEKSRQRQIQLYRLLAESSPDAICLIDLDGTVEYANQTAITLHRSTPERFIGQPMSRLHAEEEDIAWWVRFHDVIASGKAARLDMRCDEGGRARWQDTWMMPLLNRSGDVHAVMEVSRDVTARKRSEEEVLRHCLELKNIVQRKDRVFEILSNDAGSPSNTLLNICEAILAGFGTDALHESHGSATPSRHEPRRPAPAADDEVSASQTTGKYISLHVEDVNLNEMTEAALAACGVQIREGFIRVDNRVGSDVTARANPKMIRAIVSGVISDAIANTALNGEVVLRGTRDARGTELSVDFTCTAHGIAESPGLRTCRELVEMQGGSLNIVELSSTSRRIHFTVPDEQPVSEKNHL